MGCPDSLLRGRVFSRPRGGQERRTQSSARPPAPSPAQGASGLPGGQSGFWSGHRSCPSSGNGQGASWRRWACAALQLGFPRGLSQLRFFITGSWGWAHSSPAHCPAWSHLLRDPHPLGRGYPEEHCPRAGSHRASGASICASCSCFVHSVDRLAALTVPSWAQVAWHRGTHSCKQQAARHVGTPGHRDRGAT